MDKNSQRTLDRQFAVQSGLVVVALVGDPPESLERTCSAPRVAGQCDGCGQESIGPIRLSFFCLENQVHSNRRIETVARIFKSHYKASCALINDFLIVSRESK